MQCEATFGRPAWMALVGHNQPLVADRFRAS
jgi:hypothetical protein